MATAQTPFVETEALLLALDDADADSGNTDATVDYLIANLLPGELSRLQRAAGVLSDACRDARHGVERRAAKAARP